MGLDFITYTNQIKQIQIELQNRYVASAVKAEAEIDAQRGAIYKLAVQIVAVYSTSTRI